MNRFTDPDAGRDVARYLGLHIREEPTGSRERPQVHGTVVAIEHLREPDGSIGAGALLALADTVAGICGGLAALPAWVVSTNLMLRAVPCRVLGPLGIRAQVLRAGRAAVVTGVTVVDQGAADTFLAGGALTSAVLQPEGGAPDHDRPLELVNVAPPTAPPIATFVGARPVAADQLAVDITERLRNPWGILHGGVTAALVDLAGRHQVGGIATTDVVLHFLRPGRVGPAVATVDPIGLRPDGALLRVEVRDQGADDRVMAVAVTTVRT